MSSKAMSHMLCIGYGRFPPQNLTDLWLTIFRWGNVISQSFKKMRKWYGVVLQVRAKVLFLYFFRTHPWSKSYHTYKNTNSAWWLERPVMPCFLGMPPTLYRFKHIMVINIIISLQVRPTFQHRNQPWLLAWILKKNITVKKILEFGLVTTPVPGETETGQTWPKVFDQIYAKIQILE